VLGMKRRSRTQAMGCSSPATAHGGIGEREWSGTSAINYRGGVELSKCESFPAASCAAAGVGGSAGCGRSSLGGVPVGKLPSWALGSQAGLSPKQQNIPYALSYYYYYICY